MKAFAILLLAGVGLVIGCEKDSTDNGPTGTANRAPVIQAINATPTTISSGNWESDLQCVATDADGDSIRYYWSCESGEIRGGENLDPSATWFGLYAPSGDYWITIQVSDSRAIATDSVKVSRP